MRQVPRAVFHAEPGFDVSRGRRAPVRRGHLHALRRRRRRSARAERLEVLQQVPCAVLRRECQLALSQGTRPGTHRLGRYLCAGPRRAGGGRTPERMAVLQELRSAVVQRRGFQVPRDQGSAHLDRSGNYRLHHTADDWQRDWRLCAKCAGLFFGPNIAQSRCSGTPQGSGPHVVYSAPAYTHNYFLALGSPDAPGQGGWRWCHRCQGLWMGLNANSVCPATGAHSKQGSGEYRVIENADANGPGEKGWRWCYQCQGLHYGGIVSGVAHKCPVGGGRPQDHREQVSRAVRRQMRMSRVRAEGAHPRCLRPATNCSSISPRDTNSFRQHVDSAPAASHSGAAARAQEGA